MSEPKDKAVVASVDSIVLLPCPFCGGDAEILESSYKPNSNTIYEYKAYCIQCNAEIVACSGSKSEAAADWNRRDGDPCPHNAADQQARTNEPRSGQMMLRALLHPFVMRILLEY